MDSDSSYPVSLFYVKRNRTDSSGPCKKAFGNRRDVYRLIALYFLLEPDIFTDSFAGERRRFTGEKDLLKKHSINFRECDKLPDPVAVAGLFAEETSLSLLAGLKCMLFKRFRMEILKQVVSMRGILGNDQPDAGFAL